MLNIIYMGTPQFAVQPLKELISRHNVLAVITQPDRGKNRKGALLQGAVKQFASENGIKVYQFEKIKNEGIEVLKSLGADLFVTCAYGQILSQQILDIPRFGTFNIHASILPKYRGSAPVQWAIINGEKSTGITIMKTDIGVDTGDIILQNSLEIGENENAGQLMDRLSQLGSEMIIQALEMLENGIIIYTKQNEDEATRYPMLRKIDGEIDFSQSAYRIHNKIRGLTPFISCFCYMDGIMIKVVETEITDDKTVNNNIGEIVESTVKTGLKVACGTGTLRLKKLQLAGGKIMPDTEMLKGRKIPVGTVLYSGN